MPKTRGNAAANAAGLVGAMVAPLPASNGAAVVKVPDHASRTKTAALSVRSVPVGLIEADPDQPRKTFGEESLNELGESLKSSGQLQPGMAYWHEPTGTYRLIFGERRFRALVAAGLTMMDLRVLPTVPTKAEIRKIQRVENLQREDLDPIEEALDYRRAIDEDGLTAKELAAELGIPPSRVTKSVALVKLPQAARNMISEGVISPRAGYALSRLPVARMLDVAERAVREFWITTRIEAEVEKILNPAPDPDQGELIRPEIRAEEPASDFPVKSSEVGFTGDVDDDWRDWPTKLLPIERLSVSQVEALNTSDVRTLGALSDRLSGGGFPGLSPAEHQQLDLMLDELIKTDPIENHSEYVGRLTEPGGLAPESHPVDAHVERVNRLAETGRLAPEPKAIRPSDPRETGEGVMFALNPGDGRVGSILVHSGPTPGLALIEFLEAALRGARLTCGPASAFPVGSRVVIEKPGHHFDGHQGRVQRYEDSGEACWVSLDAGKLAPALDIFRPDHLRRLG